MSSLRLLLSDSHDPLFNLAVEECIFRQMDPAQRVLFLWRNDNTVVSLHISNSDCVLKGAGWYGIHKDAHIHASFKDFPARGKRP